MKKILNKIIGMPVSLKATIVFAISSFATSGINYITTPIFTRLLTNAQYGTVAVYNSWYAIIRVFATMTLIFPGILNVGLYEHKENRWKYLSSMLGLTTFTTMVISIVYAFFDQQVNALLSLPGSLVTLILIACFSEPAKTFWMMKQRYEYRYQITFVVSVGSAVLAQAFAVAAVILCSNNGFQQLDVVRLWSAGIINFIVGLILFVYICKKGKSFIDIPLWKTTLCIALPLIPHYLGSELLSSIDKIMIGAMVGDDKAGIYSLAAIISSIGVLLWRALSIMYSPFINEKLGQRDFVSVRKCVKPLLIIAGMFCIIAALAAPEIIHILATEDYMEGIYVVPPIAAGVFIHALYDLFSAVSFFNKKSFNIMIATVTAAVTNIVLNYIFIMNFGYLAAGYTTMISNLVLVGMHYLNMRKLEKEQIYDGAFSLKVLCAVILGCISANWLYSFTILRYIMIVGILYLMFKIRRQFINAIAEMKI